MNKIKESAFVSVVAYIYNVEQSVSNFLKVVDAVLYEKFETYEIILVNDFSNDQTLTTIRDTIKELNGNIIIINLLTYRESMD